MQFIDLKAQQERIGSILEERIAAVLAHGHYILGPEVAELEKELALRTGTQRCVTCANGTDALLMALRALGIGPGHAVLTTAFSFLASAD
ncbi:MAG: DegT/DnrJ/EryC1/StrS family aminotransferase, partial [Bacteroidales bacterium]|nr:DegT/DnrJ/EryC1/StrS family aminotransferase [Candidatus Latescibacterota bacterium]